MQLGEIWRYPVKSMAGERLPAAALGPLGVEGDRRWYVVDGRGQIVSARNRPRLLQLHPTLQAGEPWLDGLRWDEPAVARRVREAAGDDARLVRASDAERFDVLPLLVATDGALREIAAEVRRFRPNLVIAGVEGFAERDWEGRFARLGSAVVGFAQLRNRCVMVTWDPDTLEQDRGVLRRIGQQLGGSFALDSWVATAGTVSVGDAVELVSEPATVAAPRYGRFA